MNNLTTGMTNEVKAKADEKRLAVNMGSGTLRVLATPAVAALMEKAACELVQPYLPEGITSVGTAMSMDHLSATPCGAEIRAVAKLTEILDRKYCFDLEAYDNAGMIAKGTHTRFAVKTDRFMEKTEAKLSE